MVEAELCNIIVNVFFKLGIWVGAISTMFISLGVTEISTYFRNKKYLLLIKNTDDKKIFCLATGLKYKEEK